MNSYTIQQTYRYNPYTYTRTFTSAAITDEFVTNLLRNQVYGQSLTIRRNGVLITDLDLRFDAIAERRTSGSASLN